MFVCWAAKGGSGTTVTACALAMQLARNGACSLIDLGGDASAALGAPLLSEVGVYDWMQSTTATVSTLTHLARPVGQGLSLVAQGRPLVGDTETECWRRLALTADAMPGSVVIDAGSTVPHPELLATGTSLLVTRSCYLSLRRAATAARRIDGVVLVTEPGRALNAADVEHAVGAPVLAEIAYDPAVARAVDAGLLLARMPRPLWTSMRRLAA
jgi:hypothetical protein